MQSFQEKMILKACLQNKFFSSLLYNVFDERNFDDPYISKLIRISLKHHREFNNLPSLDIILEKIGKEEKELEPFKDIVDKSLMLDVSVGEDNEKDLNYVIEETDKYIKKQALKNSIIDSVNIIGDDDKDLTPDEYNKIKDKIESSLTNTIKKDIGLNYFDDMSERLKRVFNVEETKIPTYYQDFDEFINGGIGSYSLSIILAKVHGYKSTLISNIASRQVLNGKNVVIFSLEMSEDAYAQRHDAIFSSMDINRIYVSSNNRKKLLKTLIELKNDKTLGSLFIKQFPTGIATTNDFKVYLNEMKMRGFNFDIMFVDYMNLMKPTKSSKKGDMYTDVKGIAEELRALSYEYNGIPVISASQLNREGAMSDFSSVNMFYVSESLGVSATSDFMIILGLDESEVIYKSELHYKIAKNRFGGRVDETGKFYVDQKTLKIYDSSDLEEWKLDAGVTDKDLYNRREERQKKGRTI